MNDEEKQDDCYPKRCASKAPRRLRCSTAMVLRRDLFHSVSFDLQDERLTGIEKQRSIELPTCPWKPFENQIDSMAFFPK